jgi:hypothetical protein
MWGRSFFSTFPHQETSFAVIRNHPPAQPAAQQTGGSVRAEASAGSDVMAVGGWTDPSCLTTIYQQPAVDTMLRVATEAAEVREVQHGRIEGRS